MPESFERESEENYNGPVNAEGKSVYGKRNPNAVVEARPETALQAPAELV